MGMGKKNKTKLDEQKIPDKQVIVNDPAKNNITGWCKADKIDCTDESSRNTHFSWALLMNKQVMIYKQPHLSDRIYIQSQIRLSTQHEVMLDSKSELKSSLMYNLTITATNLDMGLNFQITDGKLKGITLSKIHFGTTISKSDLLRLYMRVQQVHLTLLNQLNNTLGMEFQQSNQNQDEPNASDVGIG